MTEREVYRETVFPEFAPVSDAKRRYFRDRSDQTGIEIVFEYLNRRCGSFLHGRLRASLDPLCLDRKGHDLR